MTQEEIQTIIDTVEGVVINQEPVYGGFRPLQKRYVHADGVLIENIRYVNDATSDGWAAIAQIVYEEGEPVELSVFRSWNISDHPHVPGVYRRVDAVDMKIDALTVRLILLVKHFTDEARTIPAPYSTKWIRRTGDMEPIPVSPELQSLGFPEMMPERELWHQLTLMGMTPYQLLDQRIPEMDSLEVFNNY